MYIFSEYRHSRLDDMQSSHFSFVCLGFIPILLSNGGHPMSDSLSK